MKTNQFRSLAAVGLLWLMLGVGCQKDPPMPDCKNGSCCFTNTTPQFVKRLEGSRAEYNNLTFLTQEPIEVVNGIPVDGSLVCGVQEEMIEAMHLKSNTTIENGKFRLIDSARGYPYRVWGIIYRIPEFINVAPIPTYAIRVEKVEEVY